MPAVVLPLVLALFSLQSNPIVGSWEGALQLPTAKLRIRLHIASDPAGALTAKMDSPDQGAFGIPVNTIAFAGDKLTWSMAALRASFEGTLNKGTGDITGTFTQGAAALPLSFKRLDAAAGPHRPQTPKPPFPYSATDVAFPSKAPNVTLAATLTVPSSAAPHPAVILISGSGPQDRDESLMGHQPFLVLADHLSRNGIAVLRYDDRGIAKSTGDFSAATSLDFSYDAEGALEYLAANPAIDKSKIGFIGHSEGGLIAPMIAARRPGVAFIVLLAGTAVPGADVILEQAMAIAQASGVTGEALAQARAKQAQFTAIYKNAKTPEELDKQIRAFYGDSSPAQLRQSLSPWFRFFMTYDPALALRKVKCPVLALNGDKDLQVLPDQNLSVLAAALKSAGNNDVTITRLPGLNHLFQSAKTGLVAEYASIEETINPAALNAVSTWIKTRTAAK